MPFSTDSYEVSPGPATASSISRGNSTLAQRHQTSGWIESCHVKLTALAMNLNKSFRIREELPSSRS